MASTNGEEMKTTRSASKTMSKGNKGKRGKGLDEEEEVVSFELCELCRLNHDQGRQHKYKRSHRKALDDLLSRIRSKVTELRFFLKNPHPLRPEDSPLSRLWCPFCSLDLRELGSRFACGNAIKHMASPEHLKNMKHFLWKHGGGIDRVDSFRITDADFVKWERSCEGLKSVAMQLNEGSDGPLSSLSRDIQFENTSNITNSFEKNSFASGSSSVSHAVVMPLQSLTTEGYQGYSPKLIGAATVGSTPSFSTPSMNTQGNMSNPCMHVVGGADLHRTAYNMAHLGENGKGSVGWYEGRGMERRNKSGEGSNQVLQNLTTISLPMGGCQANVHTGATPPWLERSDETERNLLQKGVCTNNFTCPRSQKGSKRKLNPKRVGAAWAEKRRIELEKEKRGEAVASSFDPNWLPNFGRVWQAGTRKESRKEFEIEKPKFFKEDNQSDGAVKIQPYVSKRMRAGSENNFPS